MISNTIFWCTHQNEKGYKKTTLTEIIEKADVSYSSFQKIFRVKDSALNELVEFMFSSQFN